MVGNLAHSHIGDRDAAACFGQESEDNVDVAIFGNSRGSFDDSPPPWPSSFQLGTVPGGLRDRLAVYDTVPRLRLKSFRSMRQRSLMVVVEMEHHHHRTFVDAQSWMWRGFEVSISEIAADH